MYPMRQTITILVVTPFLWPTPCAALVSMRHEVAFQVANAAPNSRKDVKKFNFNGGLDSCPCLVLNADYQPLSYLPLRSEQNSFESLIRVRVSTTKHIGGEVVWRYFPSRILVLWFQRAAVVHCIRVLWFHAFRIRQCSVCSPVDPLAFAVCFLEYGKPAWSSLWCWQDVIKAVFMDKVVVVATYGDRKIRSARMEVKLPSVIALKVGIHSCEDWLVLWGDQDCWLVLLGNCGRWLVD